MTHVIHSNGSGTPRPIGSLFSALETYTLCPRFEVSHRQACSNPEQHSEALPFLKETDRGWRAFGNFHDVSHVFRIDITGSALAERLRALIKTNMSSSAYALAKESLAAREARLAVEVDREARLRRD